MEDTMTIRSVLCVLNGSPEEISTLHAALDLAGLDQSTMRLLPVTATPQTLADINNAKTGEVDIIRDMIDGLVESLNQKIRNRYHDIPFHNASDTLLENSSPSSNHH